MNSATITAAYEKFIETEERRQPQTSRPYVYAGSWTKCTRQMALEMLAPDQIPAFRTDTLANFRRGNDRARDIKADLTRLGRLSDPPFEVVGAEERFEIRDKKGRIAIVGKVDLRLKFAGTRGAGFPLETKNWNPNLTARVKTYEDLFHNRWTRKGALQILVYLLGANEQHGFMVLDRPGIPLILDVDLMEHLDKAEDFLARAEIAMDAKERCRLTSAADMSAAALESGAAWELDLTQLPPYIDDPAECKVCSFFGSVCQPPLSYDAAHIVTDETMIQTIERHEDLYEAQSEYAGLHKKVLDYCKKAVKKGVEQTMIAGKHVIKVKWNKNTTTDLPKDVKAMYTTSDPSGKIDIEITNTSEKDS